ncbi:MAG: 4-hydroxy-tetrahydrodipicolinate reductase [Bacteroidales bacterium]
MNIALIGYGKMGREIELIAHERNHHVILTFDSEADWEIKGDQFDKADIAMEFSVPELAPLNIRRCFNANVPVIIGTTGWYDNLETLRNECIHGGHSMFYASNFSVSVNIFFEINRQLAKMMNPFTDYEVNIEEIHHIHKIDAPSGTAIALANDIIRYMERKEKWGTLKKQADEEIAIKSVRQENEPGTHIVTYESLIDTIEIKHTAKSRRGFAMGAVFAAEFMFGKKGIYTMSDLLQFNI